MPTRLSAISGISMTPTRPTSQGQMSTAIRQAGRFGGRSVVVAVTVQETSLLAPDYGLTVRSDTESASSVSNAGSAHSSSETVLESLTPGA